MTTKKGVIPRLPAFQAIGKEDPDYEYCRALRMPGTRLVGVIRLPADIMSGERAIPEEDSISDHYIYQRGTD